MSYESDSIRRQKAPTSQSDATTAFVRRFDADLHAALTGTPDELSAFKSCLLDRMADPINLHRALQYLRRHGGVARGQDRLAVHDLDRDEGIQLCEALGELILSGQYRRSAPRLRKIPKPPPKTGTRTIAVFKVADRVAARGAYQLLIPLLDPLMDDCSFGFRPHRGRLQALAEAERLTKTDGRPVWVLSDVVKAFDRLPRQRLLQLLAAELPRNVVRLLETMTDTGRKRGIPQGLAVSPLCLNFYLNKNLDQKWRRLHPDWPIIRYADDIAIFCRSLEEATKARQALERLMTDISLPLQPADQRTIVDLRAGQHAQWLGYHVRLLDNAEMAVSTPAEAWLRLQVKLQSLNTTATKAKTDKGRRQTYWQLLAGWTIQRGPSVELADPATFRLELHRRLRQAVEKPPTIPLSKVKKWCKAARDQWERAARSSHDSTRPSSPALTTELPTKCQSHLDNGDDSMAPF